LSDQGNGVLINTPDRRAVRQCQGQSGRRYCWRGRYGQGHETIGWITVPSGHWWLIDTRQAFMPVDELMIVQLMLPAVGPLGRFSLLPLLDMALPERSA
jgi:hypothetical protein